MSVSFVPELGFTTAPDFRSGRGAIVPELCVPETDIVLTSVLLTWADIVAGVLSTASTLPRVCMTLDLNVRVLARPPVGPVEARAEILKTGSTTTLTETWFTAPGRPAPFAVSHGTFVASPRPQDTIDISSLSVPRGERPLLVPLPERLGCRVVAPGVVEVDRTDDLLNHAGTLQGGVIAVLAELAALSLTTERGTVVHDLDVRYLRATRVGPARATARVVDAADARTVRVEVRDSGADDRLVGMAVARCGPPPG